MARFNSLNARENALRSVAARRAAAAELKARLAQVPAPTGLQAAQNLGIDNARAREYDLLLQKLKEQLAKERDPMRQDRLASAIARLEEVY